MGKWFLTQKGADFAAIVDKFKISPVLARLIRNRDVIGDEAIGRYLYGSLSDLHDPMLMKDMEKAVSMITDAISQKKKIRVIGDYDADGICATYILVKGMRSLSACPEMIDYVIPHRIHDGYGLNEELIVEAAEDGVAMIVTCDNGIAAAPQIALAHEKGMQVVVTDHHEVPFKVEGEEKIELLPPADAVVDPKQSKDTYPFSGICGAVVAFKLVDALGISRMLLDALVEPAGFATICDIMELQDENRILVKAALQRMKNTAHPGLKALMNATEIKSDGISAYHIGFVLGPCMNASGRLESATLALELWMQESYETAVPLAITLKDLNDARKSMTEQNVLLAQKKLEDAGAGVTDKVLVVYLPECHESLAGIVAGRLKEAYNRPTIVLTKGKEGVKGSGRSIEGYDLFENLSAHKELFTKFGGHKMAAGLSMDGEDKVMLLAKALNENCPLTDEDLVPVVHIDLNMPLSFVTEDLVEELHVLEPFGMGNTKPVFAQKNVPILSINRIGRTGNTVKLMVKDETGRRLEMLFFHEVDKLFDFLTEKYGLDVVCALQNAGGEELGVTMNITYYPSVNEFRGRRTLQLLLTDYC